jgi:MFS transporter, DHA3 family, tetracycline resistance protein
VSATGRSRTNPYRLYVFGLGFGGSLLMAIVNTTSAVYWVTSGHLNALQLLLLGTALEVTYFTFQLPTGVLADLVSRRLCVIVGWFITGAAFVLQGLSPAYANLLAAQVIFGIGVALTIGAEEAWIADELAGIEMTSVYVRATQFGLVADLVGALASGGLAYLGLNVPMLIGGAGMIGLATFLAITMPENHFRPDAPASIVAVVRGARGTFAAQTRAGRRAVVAVPGLVLLLAMTAFVGAWSESFDRLWGAFLIREITFPHLYGLRPALWFSLIACVVAVISLGSTELARRRTERLGPTSVVGTLLVVTVLIGLGSVLFASAHAFAVAIAAYLLIEILRPVSGPLLNGWVVARVEPGVRATALSAQELFDAGGQIVGGPSVGVIGRLLSIRAALYAGAAALVPAIVLLVAATRRMRAHPEYVVDGVDIEPGMQPFVAGPPSPGIPAPEVFGS